MLQDSTYIFSSVSKHSHTLSKEIIANVTCPIRVVKWGDTLSEVPWHPKVARDTGHTWRIPYHLRAVLYWEEIWMAPPWLSTVASIGMAVGPPLVYLDQTVSIIKKKYALLLAARIIYSHRPAILGMLLVFLETFVQFCAHITPFFC